jgi:AcrR family transcriptional regulator
VTVKRQPERRLSRSESKAATRARVLDAAETAFAAEGFGGASLDRIAEAAGLTRGAIYSSFRDKADLFAAVLDRRLARRSDEIADAIAAAGDASGFVDALRSEAWADGSADGAVRWSMLYDEYRLFALRNPSASEHLARHERLERDLYAEAIRHFNRQLPRSPDIDERLAAAMLLALDHGLYRQHRIDPEDVSERAFADAVELLLRASAALANQPAPSRSPAPGARSRQRPISD